MARPGHSGAASRRALPAPGLVLCVALSNWLASPWAAGQPALMQGPQREAQQPRSDRPNPVRGRLLALFDFEERETNPGDVPQYWFRNQDSPQRTRAGFPAWNQARLSYADEQGLAAQGQGSVMLPSRGGSTALIIDAGVLPIFEDADYSISALVRTQGAANARACIVSRILAADGSVIPGTQVVSELVASEDAWRDVRLRTSSSAAGAAYIQLELMLIQPRQIDQLLPAPQRPSDAHRVYPEDFDARAWFDNVAVLQLPRVALDVQESVGGLWRGPQPPRVRVQVRDLSSESLTLTLDALDSHGLAVTSTQRPLSTGTALLDWTPALPGPGWYRLRLRLDNASGTPVGGTYADVAWLAPTRSTETQADPASQQPADVSSPVSAASRPDGASRGPASSDADLRRFALCLESLPEQAAASLPAMLERAEVHIATLPAWNASLRPAEVPSHAAALQSLLRQLVAGYVDTSLSLPRLPDSLAEDAGLAPADVSDVFERDAGMWGPYLQRPLEMLGTLSDTWRVGPLGSGAHFERSPDAQALSRARTALGQRVGGLTLDVATPLSQAWDAASTRATGPMRLSVSIPRDATPAGLRASARSWAGPLAASSRDLTLRFVLHTDPDSELDPGAKVVTAPPRVRAARIVRQAVEAWRMLGESIAPGASPRMELALADPWRWSASQRDQPGATPELAAFLALRDVLADHRIVGPYSAPSGVTAYVLAPRNPASVPARGWLIAWNETARPDQAFVEFPRTDGQLVLRDILGVERPALNSMDPSTERPAVTPGDATLRIRLGEEPVLLGNIDVPLAQFLAGVRVGPTLLDAAVELGEHSITLANPWPQTISGKLSILEPGGFDSPTRDRSWRITPRVTNFSIPPGQTRDFPFTVAFRSSEEAGPRRFVMAVDLSNDLPVGVLRVERELEVGLKDYRVDGTWTRRGDDIVVEAIITNTATQPLTLEVTAMAPGSPRSRAMIPDLTPGAQAIRRFSYKGGAATMLGQRVVLSVVNPSVGERLNKSVELTNE